MESLSWRRKVVLGKPEVTYGVDPTPTGGANAIKAFDVDFTPKSEEVVHETVADYLGSQESVIAGLHAELAFSVELSGSGTPGTVPPYGALLKACLIAETVNADTSVVYTPVSAPGSSMTFYFNHDGAHHSITGARGTVVLEIAERKVPALRFTFTGLWTTPSAVAMPTPDFTSWVKGVIVNNANTTGSLHGYAAGIYRFSIDHGAVSDYEDIVNHKAVSQGAREAKGSLRCKAVTFGTFNPWPKIESAVLDTVQIVHGTSAGNIVQIDAPRLQIVSAVYSQEKTGTAYDLNFKLVPDAGNDDWSLTVK